MTDQQTMTRKEFPNGDVALDKGEGLVYRTADAAYSVELDLPSRPLSDEPYGVDLVRTTHDAHGDERQQRLTLAEYRSQMAAEEHVREVERTLLDQGVLVRETGPAGYLRVSAGTPQEMAAFYAALEGVRADG